MSFFRPLRNNRTRISSRGMLGGPRRPPGNAKPVMADLGAWGPAPQDYMPPAPQSYDPHNAWYINWGQVTCCEGRHRLAEAMPGV